ncbi:MAG: septal ring lytic transglycosylase RlpA family protein [Myroides sp.]|nr:septal ring lytic transglycosylase RlpA family protein [Myroides sp.]
MAYVDAVSYSNFSNDSSEITEKKAELNSELIKINTELEALEDEVEVVHEKTLASYYHDKFNGRKTASGSIFNNKNYTAAHKTLPFGTKVRVTNLKNSKEIIVEINDRGPFIKGRQLDLSKKAFMDLAQNKNNGVLNVKIEVLPEDYQEKKVELQEELNTIAAIPTDLDLNEFAL